MTNKAFYRSIHSLTHPITIMAVVGLLLNDHLLRIHWPSWWTGKLGDFTWLIFAPLICSLLMSWIVPRNVRNHERVVGLLSIVTVGIWFTLAKITPFVHQITTNTLDTIVGWQGTLRIDPIDLITLPALLITWHIWQQSDNRPINLKPIAYAIFALGIVGTLATSPIERIWPMSD